MLQFFWKISFIEQYTRMVNDTYTIYAILWKQLLYSRIFILLFTVIVCCIYLSDMLLPHVLQWTAVHTFRQFLFFFNYVLRLLVIVYCTLERTTLLPLNLLCILRDKNGQKNVFFSALGDILFNPKRLVVILLLYFTFLSVWFNIYSIRVYPIIN